MHPVKFRKYREVEGRENYLLEKQWEHFSVFLSDLFPVYFFKTVIHPTCTIFHPASFMKHEHLYFPVVKNPEWLWFTVCNTPLCGCVMIYWHWAFRVLRNAQRTGAVLKLSGRGRKFGKENMLDCLWTQDQWSEGMWIFFSLLIYFAFLHLLVIVNIVLYVVNHLYLFSCESLVHAPLAHFSIRFHWFADALCALGILTFVLVNVFHIFSPGLPFVS